MATSILKRLVPKSVAQRFRGEAKKETHMMRAIRATNCQAYIEIGVRDGACFVQIDSPLKIGVDPAPRGFGDNLKPGEKFFKITSDEFFDHHAVEALQGKKVDVALVDGLHEFNQALRDILNLEKHMSEKGVIFVHDCNPPTRQHAGDQDSNAWNGDVWKIAYYLRHHRPDLDLFTLDCDWGVGVVRGFRPGADVPAPSAELLAEITALDYDVLDQNREAILKLKPPTITKTLFKA